MGIQKYRNDIPGEVCKNGAHPWYTKWMGGLTLACIRNCPNIYGARTAYIQAEPDTFFSQPAKIRVRGRTILGYVYCEDGEWEFREHSCPIRSIG